MGSEILLDIGPHLLTVPVEVDKNEEARARICLAVDTARPSIKLSFFVAVKGPHGSAAVAKRQDSFGGAFSHTVKANQFTTTMLMPLHQPTTTAISRCTSATLLSSQS